MLTTRTLRSAVSVAMPVALFALVPALGQPPATPAQPATPAHPATPAQPAQPAHATTPAREDDPTGMREKMRQELREHPRIARAIVELHETKWYLEHAAHDFGGHRVEAIKSIDESIKQLKEALKFDEKHEDKGDKPGDRPRERRRENQDKDKK